MTKPGLPVLVVEDNAENLYLATVLLEAEGYEVVPARSGSEAMAAIGTQSFAFVLLDLQLPDHDGFEVATEVRTRLAADTLPIIAVSAFALPAERRRAFAAGCTGYLEKPIDVDAFVAQVRCFVGAGPGKP